MLQLFAFAGRPGGTWAAWALMLFATPCFAQSPNLHIASAGRWSVDCTAEPQTGEKWCQIGTTIESGQPPFSLQFNYVRDSRMFFARGSFWLTDVRVVVDSQPEFQLDRCLSGMCLLKGDGGNRLLELMRSGSKVLLTFESKVRTPGRILIDLAGFEPMYQRMIATSR